MSTAEVKAEEAPAPSEEVAAPVVTEEVAVEAVETEVVAEAAPEVTEAAVEEDSDSTPEASTEEA